MTDRSRAWRRRKTRMIVGKIQRTKDWIVKRIAETKPKEGAAAKPHKIAKPVRAQDLRRAWQLNEDLIEGMAV